MDNFKKRIRQPKSLINRKVRKKVTLFYFDYKDSLFGKKKLSEKTETVFGEKYKYAEKIWPKRKNLFKNHKNL